MAYSPKRKGPKALGELTGRILDPAFQKRAGVSSVLLISWADIVGENFSKASRPEKLHWPPRKHSTGRQDQGDFEQATLIIACEGAISLHIQHKQDQIVQRCNRILGYSAVGRIKIVQKPVSLTLDRQRPRVKQLTKTQTAFIDDATQNVADEGLRDALARLGRSILSERKG